MSALEMFRFAASLSVGVGGLLMVALVIGQQRERLRLHEDLLRLTSLALDLREAMARLDARLGSDARLHSDAAGEGGRTDA